MFMTILAATMIALGACAVALRGKRQPVRVRARR
jgi:hypothetical protein